MPTSYQSPMRQDHEPQHSKSQGPESNLAVGTVRVSDLLQRKGNDVHTIRPQDTLAFAVERLSELRIGALVVTHSTGALAGILSERDVVRKIAEVQLDLFPLIKVTLIRASFLLCLSLRFTGNQSENENAQQGF